VIGHRLPDHTPLVPITHRGQSRGSEAQVQAILQELDLEDRPELDLINARAATTPSASAA
jgi:hypothetical protein